MSPACEVNSLGIMLSCTAINISNLFFTSAIYSGSISLTQNHNGHAFITAFFAFILSSETSYWPVFKYAPVGVFLGVIHVLSWLQTISKKCCRGFLCKEESNSTLFTLFFPLINQYISHFESERHLVPPICVLKFPVYWYYFLLVFTDYYKFPLIQTPCLHSMFPSLFSSWVHWHFSFLLPPKSVYTQVPRHILTMILRSLQKAGLSR